MTNSKKNDCIVKTLSWFQRRDNLTELNQMLNNIDLLELQKFLSVTFYRSQNQERLEYVENTYISKEKNKKRFWEICKEEKIDILEYVASLLKNLKLTESQLEFKSEWIREQKKSQEQLLESFKDFYRALLDYRKISVYDFTEIDLNVEFGTKEARVENKRKIENIHNEFSEISKMAFELRKKLKTIINRQEKLLWKLCLDYDKETKILEKKIEILENN